MAVRVMHADAVLRPDGWTTEPVRVDAHGRIVGDATGLLDEAIDLTGLVVVPGLIDLQVNGGWGIDLGTQPDGVWEIGRRLARYGVTGFAPTLTSHALGPGASVVAEACAVLGAGPPDGWLGATPLGWHLEGPWLCPERAGAHPIERLQPLPAEVPAGFDRERGVVLVTLAPELDGADDVVRELTARGVVVAAGHSMASHQVARDALGWGITAATHLFNAMAPLHHREPGLAGAALLEYPFVGLIADGHHVAPPMIEVAWRLASDRLVLVSDLVAACGIGDDEVARTADGTLAGGVTTLDRCVATVIAITGGADRRVLSAATARPAAFLRIDDRGAIEPGRRADLVGLDHDGSVALTLVEGAVAYDRDGRVGPTIEP